MSLTDTFLNEGERSQRNSFGFARAGYAGTAWRPAYSAVSGGGAMKKVVGVENLLAESNFVELAPFAVGVNIPIAVQLNCDSAAAIPPAYASGDIMICGNKIRYLDGQFDTTFPFLGYPMNVNGARSLIVLDNMLESVPVSPLRNSLCGSVTYFENRTPNGNLVTLVNPATGKFVEELDVPAEDAFVLSCFTKR